MLTKVRNKEYNKVFTTSESTIFVSYNSKKIEKSLEHVRILNLSKNLRPSLFKMSGF